MSVLPKITKRQFIRSMVAQPFFIWHSLEGSLDKNDGLEDLEDLIADPNFIWSDTEIAAKFFPNFSKQRSAKTYDVITEFLIKQLKKNGAIILKGDIELRLAETTKLLNQNKVIINPVFEFNGAIAQPLAYDPLNKTIINIKFATKLGRSDILNAYYDYSIIKNSTPISDYHLYYLEKNPQYKKHEIKLQATNFCYLKKTADVPNKNKSDKEIYFMTALVNQSIEINGEKNKKSKVVYLPKIEDQIAYINRFRNAKLTDYLGQDSTEWGDNPEWNLLLKEIKSPYFGFSGKIFKKRDIINDVKHLELKTPLSVAVAEIKKPLINENLMTNFEKLMRATNLVWYDFESFALPIAPCDYAEPNEHVVFQASVIKTTNFSITSRANLVYDPANINLNNASEIIQTIYDESAEFYIVYNKSFELGRLEAMINKLRLASHPEINILSMMVDKIKHQTFDLYELFQINSDKKFPAVLLPNQKGRASIKNVEKYLTEVKAPLKYKITQYKDLEVKNGLEAMTLAIDRSLEIIDLQKWEQLKTSLKKYCENDVLAMLAVYEFVVYLISKNNNDKG